MIIMTISEIRAIEKTGREQWVEEAGISENNEEDDIICGVAVDSLEAADRGTLSGCMYSLYSGNVIASIVLLILSIFICNEFSGGYIKNTITIPKHRWYFNISKLVTALVVIVMENIIAILAFLFAIKFLFKNIIIGDVTPLIGYLALETLLLLGMSSIIILICNIVRSKTAGIVCSLLLGMQVVILPIIVVFCNLLNFEYGKVVKFLLTLTATSIAPEPGRQVIIETLALGAGAPLIYTLLSNLVISKKDIG